MKEIISFIALLVAFAIQGSAQNSAFVQALTDSIANDSTDWRSMTRLAHYYRERSNTVRTLLWTERAFAVHPSDTLKRELATCYFQRADYNRCISLCRELLVPTEQNPIPDSSEVYLIARSFERMEMPDSTLKYMFLEADRNIENQSNLVSLCKVLVGAKMSKKAIDYLDRYSLIDSANLAVNTVKAYAYYNAGYPRKAINEYEKLLSAGDGRPTSYYYLALAYLQIAQYEISLELLQICNEKCQGTNGQALAMLGLVELEFDTLAAKGEEDIFAAIDMMQPDPKLLFRLYFGLGDYYAPIDTKKAINFFLTADKCKPGDPSLLYQLGYCYYMVKDFDNEYYSWTRYLDIVDADDNSFYVQRARQRVAKIKEEKFMSGQKI